MRKTMDGEREEGSERGECSEREECKRERRGVGSGGRAIGRV